jgi:hypothetical protein
MFERLWLIPVGFIIGTYETLIGAGGGFVLVPMLEGTYRCCYRPYLGSAIYLYLDCGILQNGSTRVRCGERSQGHLMETLVDLKGNSRFVGGFNNGVSDKG